MRRALLLALALVAGSAVADPAPLGQISRTNTVYTASQVDALLENAGGGGADPALASNLVGRVIAEAGESAAATEAWRIVLADHQRRLDAIEDADGTDALTEAQAEALIQARVAVTLTNELAEARAAYVSAETAMREAEAVFSYDAIAEYYVRTAPTDVEATSYTSTAGVSIELTRNAAIRYYGGGSTALTISSFIGISQNPCWLVLSGYTGVTWPSGSVLLAGGYTSGTTGYFRVFYVYNKAFVQKVHEQ